LNKNNSIIIKLTNTYIKMTHQESVTLYNSIENSSGLISIPSEKKYIMSYCCITEKWCFQHTGVAAIREYDKNINNCCICLDCCTWCLEFQTNKYSICKNQSICYLCCCSIYFI